LEIVLTILPHIEPFAFLMVLCLRATLQVNEKKSPNPAYFTVLESVPPKLWQLAEPFPKVGVISKNYRLMYWGSVFQGWRRERPFATGVEQIVI
jgi:hypothetical protein